MLNLYYLSINFSHKIKLIRGSSNKFLQWSHISETVIEIRILLPIACGHGCCLFVFEIWNFYHNLILWYTKLKTTLCKLVAAKNHIFNNFLLGIVLDKDEVCIFGKLY